MFRRFEGVVVPDDRQRHTDNGEKLSTPGVSHMRHVPGKPLRPEKSGDWSCLFGFFVDHYRHADTAVGVAPARELTPRRVRSVDDVSPVGKRAHERDREPVTRRLTEAS